MLRAPMPEFMVLGGMMVGRDEIKHLIRPWSSLASFRLSVRLLWRYIGDRIGHHRGTRLLLGNALVGRLLFSLRQTKARIALNTALVELIREDGAVLARSSRKRAVATSCAPGARWCWPRVDARPARMATRPDGRRRAAFPRFEGNSGDGLAARNRRAARSTATMRRRSSGCRHR
jgi:hypothetical protein